MSVAQRLLLAVSDPAYRRLIRPLLFRQTAGEAHERLLQLLTIADEDDDLLKLAELVNSATFTREVVTVGSVTLQSRYIVAAGFVKGLGFDNEDQAIAAVDRGDNIIPGWRSAPQLLGPVEFGSFTRWPRLGNSGTVLWRDIRGQSTQNRIGLKNPGAKAAARFLAQYRAELPMHFGINLAVSPGVSDPQQEQTEILEALEFFLDASIHPSWFTLNLSCPNTEDDPGGNQTESKTRELCALIRARLHSLDIPLWVKVGPDLSPSQYHILMRVFSELGVRAVIATNTLGQPVPDNLSLTAGIGGARLRPHAMHAAWHLRLAAIATGADVDVIGCGGVMDGASAAVFSKLGITGLQYWSALVFRGPLAAALIEQERQRHADT